MLAFAPQLDSKKSTIEMLRPHCVNITNKQFIISLPNQGFRFCC